MTESTTNQPDPAQAFEAVRRELSLLHSAVAGLAAEREKIPDYSETLGQMAHALGDDRQAARRDRTKPGHLACRPSNW